MKISKKIIKNLKKSGVNFYVSVPCKLLANMIKILEKDKDIYYSSVPREEANIEAEGGETVLADLEQNGTFGLYNINGPRHSSGGVPMFLPEQSFIFSDTKLDFVNKEA